MGLSDTRPCTMGPHSMGHPALWVTDNTSLVTIEVGRKQGTIYLGTKRGTIHLGTSTYNIHY